MIIGSDTRNQSAVLSVEYALIGGHDVTPAVNLQLDGTETCKSDAAQRWSNIRDALGPVEIKETLSSYLPLQMIDVVKISLDSPTCVSKETCLTAVDEKQLLSFWDDLTMPIPPVYQPVRGSHVFHLVKENESTSPTETGSPCQDYLKPPVPNFDDDFDAECKHLSLTISRVPREFVLEQKKTLEAKMLEEREEIDARVLKREINVTKKEQHAEEQIFHAETLARKRVYNEKIKCSIAIGEKEKKLSRDFMRARENLEIGIKRQAATIKEHFGDVSAAGSSQSLQYRVQSRHVPQPVEMRIHFFRALKDKLPKGKYVLMLSQYERLGGKPIGWSKVSKYGKPQAQWSQQIASLSIFDYISVFHLRAFTAIFLSRHTVPCYA